jgi:hypothetical protein
MIDIILITNNHLPLLKKTIGHIRERTRFPYRFLIVDNNSTDGTKFWLLEQQKQFPDIFKKVMCLDKKILIADAKDMALEFVESNGLIELEDCFLCPDLDPDWLVQLIDLMKRYAGFATIALRPQVIFTIPPIFAANREVVECNLVRGSFKLMRTERVRKVGGFGGSLDKKLMQLGYKTGYAKNIFCHRMFSGSDIAPVLSETNKFSKGHFARKVYAKDADYDPKTCEPRNHYNE